MSKETRPMPGGKGKGYPPKGAMKFKKGTIKRLLSYVSEYKIRLIFVVICILVSSAASVASSLFIQTLIDEYILPLLVEANPVFGGLARALMGMGVIFLTGIFATFFYNRAIGLLYSQV